MTGVTGMPGGNYAYIYNVSDATVTEGSPILFDSNGVMSGFIHTAGTADIIVGNAGIYLVNYTVSGGGTATSDSLFMLTDNSVPIPVTGIELGLDDGTVKNSWEGLLSLGNGDVLTVVNTGPTSATLTPVHNEIIDASITLVRVA